jgi:hypothetical protein
MFFERGDMGMELVDCIKLVSRLLLHGLENQLVRLVSLVRQVKQSKIIKTIKTCNTDYTKTCCLSIKERLIAAVLNLLVLAYPKVKNYQ